MSTSTEPIEDPFVGVLDSGRRFETKLSRKRAPGVERGEHFITVFVNEEKSIPDFPEEEVLELFMRAVEFATHRDYHHVRSGKFQIAMNGAMLGRRKHVHAHIILPHADDELVPIASLPNDTTTGRGSRGFLSQDVGYQIYVPTEKSPDLIQGEHYLAELVGVSGVETTRAILEKLITKAHAYAQHMSPQEHRYRLVLDCTGTAPVVHIILPHGDDRVPTIVRRDSGQGDTVKSGA